jgi:hypothetical protein
VPAIDTVPANTANWSCTVIDRSLLFNARQDYETTTNNNRSLDFGGVGSSMSIHKAAGDGNIEAVKQYLDGGAEVLR